jgi:hypothetical protein
MLLGKYFYNKTITKSVAVFGSVFNNIRVGKMMNSGALAKVSRVPIAYGARQKFLERIAKRAEEAATGVRVAIKLPRMSFEITSLSYDSSSKLNPNNRTTLTTLNAQNQTVYHPFYEGVPYKLGMQLNIMANNQDDALQIVEQILPSFTPEYTVSVLNMNGPGRSLDVPIILTGTNFSDDYEQEASSGHRLLVYTLDFEMKIKLTGNQDLGASDGQKVIKYVEVFLHDSMDTTSTPVDEVDVRLGDMVNDTPESYTVVTTFGFNPPLPDENPV